LIVIIAVLLSKVANPIILGTQGTEAGVIGRAFLIRFTGLRRPTERFELKANFMGV